MARNDLTAAQKRAIHALLEERTTRDAAKAANVGERTLYRWLRQEDFLKELHARSDAVLSGVTASLIAGSEKAVKVLVGILDDPEAKTTFKVRAALGILDRARRIKELDEQTLKIIELIRAMKTLEQQEDD